MPCVKAWPCSSLDATDGADPFSDLGKKWLGDVVRDVDFCCWEVDVSNALGQNLSE